RKEEEEKLRKEEEEKLRKEEEERKRKEEEERKRKEEEEKLRKEEEEEKKRKEEEERKRKEEEERKKQEEEEENRSSTETDQTSIIEQIKLHTDPQISIISKKSKSCWDIHQKIESTNPKAFTKINRIKQELRELQEQIKDNDLETEVKNLEAKIKDLDDNQTKLDTEIKILDDNKEKLYTKESKLGHYKYELGSAQNWLDQYKYELDSKQNWSECYQNELGTEIKELETKIEELNTKIKELETKIEELNNEINNINTTINSLIDYIDSLINNRESLINSARTLYTTALSKAKTVAPKYFAKASYANSLRDQNALFYGRKVYAQDINIVQLNKEDFINLNSEEYSVTQCGDIKLYDLKKLKKNFDFCKENKLLNKFLDYNYLNVQRLMYLYKDDKSFNMDDFLNKAYTYIYNKQILPNLSKIEYIKPAQVKYIKLDKAKYSGTVATGEKTNNFFKTIYTADKENFYRVLGYYVFDGPLTFFGKDFKGTYVELNKTTSSFEAKYYGDRWGRIHSCLTYSNRHAVLLLIPCAIDPHTK
ncbi:MAG: hypothetical protein ACI4PR_03015, partial [Acutalibacteraceae bacterium]